MAFLFSHNIGTSTYIDAPPALVRRTLLDFASYPEWCSANFLSVDVHNPKSVATTAFAGGGQAAIGGPPVGAQLHVASARSKGMICIADVVANTNAEFAWRVSFVIRRILFGSRHSFYFLPSGNAGKATEFIHRERFVGIFAGLMKRIYGRRSKNGFMGFNEALKKRCEELVAAKKL